LADLPDISVVLATHNRAACLPRAIASVLAQEGARFELIVVDDASTDGTAEVARAHGAAVVSVDVRQIAAARNAGAKASRGELLVFVDADTIVTPEVLRAAIDAWRGGAVGGGAETTADAASPVWVRRTMRTVVWIMRRAGWAAGCFLFARRDAFERAGGFDERYFAGEEIHLSRALKKHGRMIILEEAVITSGRKADHYTPWQALWLGARMLRPANVKRRQEFWYGRRR
jgi:glycosyltransferase involved in cell wall biosynthesis